MKIKNVVVAGVLVLALGNAQAALFDRGGGLIYDDVLKVTWLQDANYAKTSGYDSDGRMNWFVAKDWASGLVYRDYDDWRLPTALNQDGSGPCWNYTNGANHCTNSEMGHMYFNNMQAAGEGGSILSGTNGENLALFTNLQSNVYWSGTAYALDPDYFAWVFNTKTGLQYLYTNTYQNWEFYAWAVRDGDVAAPIPEPETYAMMLAGLGLLGVVARRRKQA